MRIKQCSGCPFLLDNNNMTPNERVGILTIPHATTTRYFCKKGFVMGIKQITSCEFANHGKGGVHFG